MWWSWSVSRLCFSISIGVIECLSIPRNQIISRKSFSSIKRSVMTELERKSNAKLNTLLEIETAVQKKWEDERIFEVEAPEDGSSEVRAMIHMQERGQSYSPTVHLHVSLAPSRYVPGIKLLDGR